MFYFFVDLCEKSSYLFMCSVSSVRGAVPDVRCFVLGNKFEFLNCDYDNFLSIDAVV